ncbi:MULTISPECIES: hypothetical protein [Vagococcus]|nr:MULTISPECIES: hypothetical protein [Vagococcus]HCM89135.1 hypothetical protein [Vagococcus sp.]
MRRNILSIGIFTFLFLMFLTNTEVHASERENLEETKEAVIKKVPISDFELKQTAEVYGENHKKIKNSWDDHWEQFTFSDYNIFITNGSKAYFISDDKVNNVDLNSYSAKKALKKADNTVGSFSKITFNKKRSISLFLGKSADVFTDIERDNFYDLAMHESFHFYEQKNWPEESGYEKRGTSYPIQEKSRTLRISIYDRLLLGYKEKDAEKKQEYISEAAYLHDRWKKEFKQEYLETLSTDISEGTASYFEKSLRRFLSGDEIDGIYPIDTVVTELSGNAEIESYILGDLALSLINQLNKIDTIEFKKNKKSPLDLLFETSARKKIDLDQENIVLPIKKNFNNINKTIGESFDELIRKDSQGSATYINISLAEFTDNLTSQGVYLFPSIQKSGIINTTIQNEKIMIKHKNIFMFETYLQIPVEKEDVVIEKNRLSIKNKEGLIIDKMKFNKKKDSNGNNVYQIKTSIFSYIKMYFE